MNRTKLIALLLLCSGASVISQGHHNNRALYNPEIIVEIEGTVTEVWYQNPHSRVYIEVSNEDGGNELWVAETLDRSQLDRRGRKYDDLAAGDYVELSGRAARDGSNSLQLLSIVRPSDGWEGSATAGLRWRPRTSCL